MSQLPESTLVGVRLDAIGQERLEVAIAALQASSPELSVDALLPQVQLLLQRYLRHPTPPT